MISETVRLHITPFTPDLCTVAVGPQLRGLVSNLSFHTIQTFPENDYGYLDLPRMEGEKLKKKLNGAILKGKKIKVEEARPKKRRRADEAEEEAQAVHDTLKVPTSGKAKKSKKEHNIVAGHELPKERKVKRGWTEVKSSKANKKDKSKSSTTKSKYTDKPELLFRTTLPANRAAEGDATKKGKSKTKTKKGEQIVHEFEKSTIQPSFLKQDIGLGIQGNLEYKEGQGWVDGNGELVEPERQGVAKRREVSKSRIRPERKSTAQPEDNRSDQHTPALVSAQTDDTSSSGSSVSDSSDEDGSSAPESSSEKQDTTTSPKVHPLEALFKRPTKPTSQDIAKPSLEISTSFSFFDAENTDDLEDEPVVPLTPFSSQEFRSRGLRSAAPTPDTAHPSRFNSYGSSGLPGDEEEDDDDPDEARSRRSASARKDMAETGPRTRSDFEKKFWENRADNNRAWKLRRRTVLKEKRQRENKAGRAKKW
jgi:hypothetical protein